MYGNILHTLFRDAVPKVFHVAFGIFRKRCFQNLFDFLFSLCGFQGFFAGRRQFLLSFVKKLIDALKIKVLINVKTYRGLITRFICLNVGIAWQKLDPLFIFSAGSVTISVFPVKPAPRHARAEAYRKSFGSICVSRNRLFGNPRIVFLTAHLREGISACRQRQNQHRGRNSSHLHNSASSKHVLTTQNSSIPSSIAILTRFILVSLISV